MSDSINKENEKLNTLNKTDEKEIIECEQPKIELHKSEEVEFLFKQLYLIDFVLMNKTNLKKLNKANLIDEVLKDSLTEKEIEYIKFLISNKNIKKEKKKVKELKK